MADRRFRVKKKASPNRPHVTLLVLLLVLLIGSVVVFWPPQDKIKQGLDVQGGLSVVLQASKTDGSAVTYAEMVSAAEIVSRRVNLLGASEASVQIQGSSQLLVQIPGMLNQTQALNTIGSTGVLEFVVVADITDETARTAITSGNALDRDFLTRYGAFIGKTDIPINAKLFIQGDADTNTEDGDDTPSVTFPDAIIKDPLMGYTLPMFQVSGANWVPLKLEPGTYTPIFSGSNITMVNVDRDERGSYFSVNITLDGPATQAFAEATTRLYLTRGQVAILLDGYVQSAPAVQNAITGGKVAITGNYTVAQANQLKTILQSGSLPVTLEVATAQVVGPTLGQDSLRSGIIVAIFGLIAVALYLLLFYRGIGLLTAGAIGVFSLLYLGVLALLSQLGFFALSLAGIAGIVLSIGVTADSSILVLERFKEEIRMGRSVRAASITGVRHAIITSIDADSVALVSALSLFFIGVGSVRGFGLTLALGLICDILAMLIFKAPLIRLLAPKVIARHPGFWGIKEDIQLALSSGEVKRGVENG